MLASCVDVHLASVLDLPQRLARLQSRHRPEGKRRAKPGERKRQIPQPRSHR